MIVLSVLLFILGVAVLVTGILGLTGKLPGNRWVGLRIPEVRKSRAMWDTGHRIIGPFWTGAGVAIILGGAVSLQGGWMWIVTILLLVGGVMLVGVGAANAAHIMAQIDLRKGQQAEARRAAAGCCSSGGNSATSSSGPKAGASVEASSQSTVVSGTGLAIPPMSASVGVAGVGDTCGGSCADCGACDHSGHSAAAHGATVPDLGAARRAMAARDGE